MVGWCPTAVSYDKGMFVADRWTEEDDNILRQCYIDKPRDEVLKLTNKNWVAIKARARRLGLKREDSQILIDRRDKKVRKDSWSEDEILLLREIYPHSTKVYILSKINRPWSGIWSRAYSMGLKRDPEIIKEEEIEGSKNAVYENRWTPEEDQILKDNYPCTHREDLLKLLGRTWKSIRSRACFFGYKRNEELSKEETYMYSKQAFIKKYGVECSWHLQSTREKTKQTNLRVRGVEYPTQSQEVRDKVIETVRSVYGVDNVFQNEEIKDKARNTNLIKYGVENPTQNKEIRDKTKETNKIKYGVENLFQLRDMVDGGMIKKYGEKSPSRVPELVEKKKKTNLERYGEEYPSKNHEVKDKISATNIGRYGYNTPLKNKIVKDKIRSTCIEKYGFTSPSFNQDVKDKTINTNLDRYGYKYTVQVPEFREKAYLTSKKNKSFSKSKPETDFKSYLKIFDNFVKQHVAHPVYKNVMDYYMPSIDLWVQFDGDYWHGRVSRVNKSSHTEKIRKTVERDRRQNELVPNLVRFWGSDVKCAIRNGTILEFVHSVLSSKVNLKICHQYARKIQTYKEDFISLPFDPYKIDANDLVLGKELLSSEIKGFIEKYEWLGNVGMSPKWCFTARHANTLAGVVIINEPASYSKLLGEDTRVYEALIQRGATASWAPANTGSKLIMFACRWMVENTPKRLFVAYGDPSAGEIGAIYQACNFSYLGDKFGDSYLYKHPSYNDGKEFSSHTLNRTSSFKKWCKTNNITTDKSWFNPEGFKIVSEIPPHIKNSWSEFNRNTLKESEKVPVVRKHKYALILGKDKRDKRDLLLLSTFKSYPYPKRDIT